MIMSTLILILILSALNLVGGHKSDKEGVNVSNTTKNNVSVKVLIYSGDGAMEESVEGIKDCLDESNARKFTPGISFDYRTSSVINSAILSSYDVLIIPGGNSATYVNGDSINSNDIKQFLSDGNGYLGICAGAYAASNSVDGIYSGWGIAPDVNTKNVIYEGSVLLSTTSSANNFLDSPNTTFYHLNGPAMYSTSSKVSSFADYKGDETGYQSYSAIMGENYGSGRVLLTGSHPELYSDNSKSLAQMILWTTKNT